MKKMHTIITIFFDNMQRDDGSGFLNDRRVFLYWLRHGSRLFQI